MLTSNKWFNPRINSHINKTSNAGLVVEVAIWFWLLILDIIINQWNIIIYQEPEGYKPQHMLEIRSNLIYKYTLQAQVPLLLTAISQSSIMIRTWINKSNHIKVWNLITHRCLYFKADLVKLPVKLGRTWVIQSPWKRRCNYSSIC